MPLQTALTDLLGIRVQVPFWFVSGSADWPHPAVQPRHTRGNAMVRTSPTFFWATSLSSLNLPGWASQCWLRLYRMLEVSANTVRGICEFIALVGLGEINQELSSRHAVNVESRCHNSFDPAQSGSIGASYKRDSHNDGQALWGQHHLITVNYITRLWKLCQGSCWGRSEDIWNHGPQSCLSNIASDSQNMTD